MRKLMGLMAICALFTMQSYASISTNQVFQLNKQMGGVASLVKLGTIIQDPGEVDGLKFHRISRSTYEPSVDGGTLSTSYGLGETIPANSVIKRAWFQVITALAGAASEPLGLSLECATSDDLYAVNANTTTLAATELEAGIPAGSTTTMISVGSSSCEVTASLDSSGTATSGKIVVWVEYVVAE